MNKKHTLIPVIPMVALYAIFTIRGFAPGNIERKLFPRYSRESIVKISLNGGETVWERKEEGWQFPVSELPVDNDTLNLILSLPKEMTKHPISSRSTGEAWLSDGYHVVYTDDKGKAFTLMLYDAPSWAVGTGEGLYVAFGEDIFRVKGFQMLSPGFGRDDIDYYLLPGQLEKENIVFIALSTPLEGEGSNSYNYRVEKDGGGKWFMSGQDEQALFPREVSAGKMTLFINHLMNLRGDDLALRQEGDPGKVRFSLDIRDNLGERYTITIGEKSDEQDETYLVTGPEPGVTYHVGRESLSNISPDGGYLLTP